jgi:hypothetical protein
VASEGDQRVVEERHVVQDDSQRGDGSSITVLRDGNAGEFPRAAIARHEALTAAHATALLTTALGRRRAAAPDAVAAARMLAHLEVAAAHDSADSGAAAAAAAYALHAVVTLVSPSWDPAEDPSADAQLAALLRSSELRGALVATGRAPDPRSLLDIARFAHAVATVVFHDKADTEDTRQAMDAIATLLDRGVLRSMVWPLARLLRVAGAAAALVSLPAAVRAFAPVYLLLPDNKQLTAAWPVSSCLYLQGRAPAALGAVWGIWPSLQL